MTHVPKRNMTLVIALLESLTTSDLTLEEYEALQHLLFDARLLASAIVARGATVTTIVKEETRER